MPLMHALRHHRPLARLILAWFLLALGVAVASPLVQPKTMQVVCSGAGVVKLVAQAADDQGTPSGHSLDCPLCLVLDAPPAPGAGAGVPDRPLSHIPPSFTTVQVAAQAITTLSARGPPAHA